MKFTFFEYFSARRFLPGLPTDPILHAWMVNMQTLDDDDDDEFNDELDDCSIHRYTQPDLKFVGTVGTGGPVKFFLAV